MRRAVAACVAVWFLLCCPAVGATPQAAADAFAEGARAFASGDWSGALAAFEAAERAGTEGPAVLYNIGVCRYRLGAYAAAEHTFVELAARYPAMAALAEYNAGLARYRQGKAAGAAEAFRRAAAGPHPTIARLAMRMLERVAPAQPMPAGSAFVDLSIGFDDNVALLDDASLAAGESTDSPFLALFGRLGTPGERGFGVAASAYLVRYPDAGEFDQDIVQVAGAWGGAWSGYDIELGPELAFSTLDGDWFERRIGARLALERRLTIATRVEARLVLETVDELDARFAFIDGSRTALRFGLERRAGPAWLDVAYTLSVDDRAAASASPTRQRVTLRYRRPMEGPWALAAAVAFRRSRYDDLAEPREEDRSELELAVYRELAAGWQLALEYRLTTNAANVDAFDYVRNRVQIGINRVFP